METQIAVLKTDIVADSSKYRAEFNDFKRYNTKAWKDIEEGMGSSLQRMSGNLQQTLARWSKWLLAALVVSPIAATAWITQYTIEINKADTAAKMFGVTIKDFQKYTYSLRGVGIADEKSLFFLEESTKRLGELQLGLSDLNSTFNKLGIDKTQFRGLSAVEGLQKLLEVTKNLDRNQRVKILDQWADGLGAVIPLLDDSLGKFSKLSIEFDKLGLGISQRQIDDAKEYATQITHLGSIWDAFKLQVAANLAAPLAEIVKGMIAAIKNAGGIEVAASKIADSILTGVKAFVDVIASLAGIVGRLANIISAIRHPVNALKSGVESTLIESVRNAPLGKYLFSKQIEEYDSKNSSGTDLSGTLSNGIERVQAQLRKQIAEIPIRDFSAATREMVKEFYTVKTPTRELAKDLEKLPTALRDILSKTGMSSGEGILKQAMKEQEKAIDIATDRVSKSAESLSKAFENAMMSIRDAGKSVGDSLGGKAFADLVGAHKAVRERIKNANELLNPTPESAKDYLQQAINYGKYGNKGTFDQQGKYTAPVDDKRQIFSSQFSYELNDTLEALTKTSVDKKDIESKIRELNITALTLGQNLNGGQTNSGMFEAIRQVQEKFLEKLDKEKPIKLDVAIDLRVNGAIKTADQATADMYSARAKLTSENAEILGDAVKDIINKEAQAVSM